MSPLDPEDDDAIAAEQVVQSTIDVARLTTATVIDGDSQDELAQPPQLNLTLVLHDQTCKLISPDLHTHLAIGV